MTEMTPPSQPTEPTEPAPSPAPRPAPQGGGKRLAIRIGAVLLGFLLAYEVVFMWIICRVTVGPKEFLVLNAKFGATNPDPVNLQVVPDGTQGIQERVLGEGRHFINPFTYDYEVHKVLDIPPGKIGVVKSKSGKPLPDGEFLANEGEKGIQRKVLSPGRYRINPYAAEVELKDLVKIRPGYVGCVTALWGKSRAAGGLAEEGERGIQKKILQPGLYSLNPYEFRVEEVEIGFRHAYLPTAKFQSRGYEIELDISVVWGVLPENVPYLVQQVSGNLDVIAEKILLPSIRSIAPLEGSKFAVDDFLDGEKRDVFQDAITKRLRELAVREKIEVLIVLVRGIEIPLRIAEPIQASKIAVEEERTKTIKLVTQQVANELERLRQDVQKGVLEVVADTERQVAETLAVGTKRVAEIRASTENLLSQIEREIAELDAQRSLVLRGAEAEVEKMLSEARASRLLLNVQAIGGPDAYARYAFAKGLPESFRVVLRYAGPGTLWTDLKDLDDLSSLKILDMPEPAPRPSAADSKLGPGSESSR